MFTDLDEEWTNDLTYPVTVERVFLAHPPGPVLATLEGSRVLDPGDTLPFPFLLEFF